MLRSALLNVMIKSARKAGRMLKRDFGEVEQLQVSLKGPANFVTAADRRAEEILREELEHARPGYGFLGEESGMREGTDKTHRWIVDPLDGTSNFLHGIPHFAISIALEREGTIVAGLIYNPANEELFTAERGKGAFLNDQRLRVAARKRLADAVVASERPLSTSPGWRPGVSTPTGNAISRRGTWRRVSFWCGKPAVSSPTWMAARLRS
jgi:myo-inositol-1(or 4)-monophosphatase